MGNQKGKVYFNLLDMNKVQREDKKQGWGREWILQGQLGEDVSKLSVLFVSYIFIL